MSHNEHIDNNHVMFNNVVKYLCNIQGKYILVSLINKTVHHIHTLHKYSKVHSENLTDITVIV